VGVIDRAHSYATPAVTFAHLNETGRLAGALKHPVIAAGGQWASLAHTLRLVR
jgi:hypothetical protein